LNGCFTVRQYHLFGMRAIFVVAEPLVSIEMRDLYNVETFGLCRTVHLMPDWIVFSLIMLMTVMMMMLIYVSK